MSKKIDIDRILGIGVFLEPLMGVHNWALNKDQFFLALKELKKIKTPILGGDVLVKNNGKFTYNYDNWSTERKKGETFEEYLIRSFQESSNYVQMYDGKGQEVYFKIVPLK